MLLGDIHISEQSNIPKCSGDIRTVLVDQPLLDHIDYLLIYRIKTRLLYAVMGSLLWLAIFYKNSTAKLN